MTVRDMVFCGSFLNLSHHVIKQSAKGWGCRKGKNCLIRIFQFIFCIGRESKNSIGLSESNICFLKRQIKVFLKKLPYPGGAPFQLP